MDFPRTHDLVVLLNLVPKDILLDLNVQSIQQLNRYIIEARYPGDWEPIGETEARIALEIVRIVRDKAREVLNFVFITG